MVNPHTDIYNQQTDPFNVNVGSTTGTTGGFSGNPFVGSGSPPDTGGGNNNNNQTNNQATDFFNFEDKKQAARQKAAQEARDAYISKLKNYALTNIADKGLLTDESGNLIYDTGYGGDERYELQKDIFDNPLFNAANDPTLNTDLYNIDSFSGDIPVSDYQKLSLLQNVGGISGLYREDQFGNPFLDSNGNMIMSGLGHVMVNDVWNAAFDPGGIRPGEDYTGAGISSFLNDAAKDYWRSMDENWYGSFNYDSYLGEPIGIETLGIKDPKFWQQKALSELDPTGFMDREMIYGEELTDRVANPGAALVTPFAEGVIEGVDV